MIRSRILRLLHSHGGKFRFLKSARCRLPPAAFFLKEERGSAILEFAISLPLLVVFVVGIYDFSSAFNQKQKIAQAAQEGAIIAGAQPTSDIAPGNGNPDSLLPVVTAVFNSLASSAVLPSGTSCTPPGKVAHDDKSSNLAWTYTISSCSGSHANDDLVITIDRGQVLVSKASTTVSTTVAVVYPYHWQFNTVIQLLIPGAKYAAITQLTESATVQNQM
jgi:Flp pilus assembly protein TadG